MAAIDDLLAKMGELGQTMKNIEESRSRLQGYRDTRDQYAALIDVERGVRDQLIEDSKAQLQALADAINAALPRTP